MKISALLSFAAIAFSMTPAARAETAPVPADSKKIKVCYRLEGKALSDYVLADVRSQGVGKPKVVNGGTFYPSYAFGLVEITDPTCLNSVVLVPKAEWTKYKQANPTASSFPYKVAPERHYFGESEVVVPKTIAASKRTITYEATAMVGGEMGFKKKTVQDAN